MSTFRASVLAIAVSLVAAVTSGTVYETAGQWTWKAGVMDKNGVAWGSYTDWTESVSGFGSLSISSNANFNDTQQAFAAGYAEAALTHSQIKIQYDNMHAWLLTNFANGAIPPAFQTFFNTQDTWTRQQVAANSSVFWQAVGSLVSQFDGLVAGYAAVAPPTDALDVWAFQQLNAMGDFLDLIPALSPGSQDADPWRWEKKSPAEIMQHVHKTTHCSGLIKIDGNYTDIWFGHSAWFIYQGGYGQSWHIETIFRRRFAIAPMICSSVVAFVS